MKNNRKLLSEIQYALAKEPSFRDSLTNIYLLVNDGAVILAGSVDNLQLKKLAQKTVSALPGVNLLIEDLKVENTPSDCFGVQIDWANSRIPASL